MMTVDSNDNNDETLSKYYIDLDWYQEQERSFVLLAASRLCPSSQKKIPKSDAALLTALKQCCSKSEQYITLDMTLAESIFRLLLANGNKPMSVEQIQAKLLQHTGDMTGSRDISAQKLKLVIDNDKYYGMTSIELDEEEVLSSSPEND